MSSRKSGKSSKRLEKAFYHDILKVQIGLQVCNIGHDVVNLSLSLQDIQDVKKFNLMRQDELMEQNESMKVIRETCQFTPVEMYKQYNVASTTGGSAFDDHKCSGKVNDKTMSPDIVAGWNEDNENKKVDGLSLLRRFSSLSLTSLNDKQLVDHTYNNIIPQLQVPLSCEYKESINEEPPGSEPSCEYKESITEEPLEPEPFDKVVSQYLEDMMSLETNAINDKDISKTSLIFTESRYNLLDNDTVSIESLLIMNGTHYNRQNEVLDQIRMTIDTDFERLPCVSILPSSTKCEDFPILSSGAKLDGYLFFMKYLKAFTGRFSLSFRPMQTGDDSYATDIKQRTRLSRLTREIRTRMRRKAEEKRKELCDSSDDNM